MTPGDTVTTAPAYAFPLRALRRWAAENLTLIRAGDGSIAAEFRLEGSTCGNVAFHVLYRVRLSSTGTGHRILGLECTPAPGDVNFHEQCEARADEARLLATLLHERPLLGQPLAEVLTWAQETSPDGCLCRETSRAHKWRAVLQTLHLALNSSP
ncbi:MAG: hypothetical protein HS122_13825 [Opitutaceae bacterium]|nr:hypothetical protein [Opitutaceae bacterium]